MILFKQFLRRSIPVLCWIFLCTACSVPAYTPADLSRLKTPQELGEASQKAYQQGKLQSDKNLKLKLAQAGIQYANKCLQKNPHEAICLYYRALNTGQFVSLHHPHYQKNLKKMIADCQTLIAIQPDFEQAGCYRVLGNIYAKAPAFSLLPEKNITQDLEKSKDYLLKAVQIAPNHALNHLFLAQTLQALGEKVEARKELTEFDRLASSNLDYEFPEWKKEREELAQKLL